MKTQQQIDNLTLALLKWGFEVPPSQVSPGLSRWGSGCGTQACFGGHITRWPEFRAQGVRSRGEMLHLDEDNFFYFQPMLVEGRTGMVLHESIRVAYELFGHTIGCGQQSCLFNSRGVHPSDKAFPSASAHEIVARRLEWELEHAAD